MDEANSFASFFCFLLIYVVNIGIKATDKAPVIKTFASKSGTTNAVLNASSVPDAPKYLAKNQLRHKPKNRLTSIRSIMIMAAESIVD